MKDRGSRTVICRVTREIAAGSHLPGSLFKLYLSQVDAYWTAALSYPTGDPYLQGSYACWGVGQYTLFAGYERVRQGPIHFAGEHCSLEMQGYMEGAACEGARAAREILQDFALPIF